MTNKNKFINFIKKIINNPSEISTRFLFFLEISCYLFLLVPLLYIDRSLPVHKRILFARFRSSRIGHFAAGFHIRYAKVKLNLYKQKCLYCFDDQISNIFLEKQIKRNFFVNRIVKIIIILCKKLPNLKCLIDYEPESSARDTEGVTQLVKMPGFNQSENKFCIDWLKKHGWKGPKQKIVCVHLRDSAFLESFFKKTKYKKINWEYHSYRDSDIDDFNESINWLLNKDVFVIRTGKIAQKRSEIIL